MAKGMGELLFGLWLNGLLSYKRELNSPFCRRFYSIARSRYSAIDTASYLTGIERLMGSSLV
jgi:hypothetical protein